MIKIDNDFLSFAFKGIRKRAFTIEERMLAKSLSTIRIIVKTVTGSLPLSWQDGFESALIEAKISPYLAQNGITVGGSLYKVDIDKYTLLDNAGSTAAAYHCKRKSDNATGYLNLETGAFTAASFTAGKDTKTINLHSEIPVELYQEVEYLGLQGDEYINTGINPSNKKIGAVIDFQCTDATSSVRGIFGSNETDGTNNCQFTVYQSKWRTKINRFAHYGTNYDTDRHVLRFNMNDGTKIDNTVITATQYTIESGNNISLLLGACSYSGEPNEYTLVGKLYQSKIYVDGTLTLDCVPAKRLSDNTYGMYDLVSKTFFGNAGSGAFTGGSANQMEVPICSVERSGERTENLFERSNKKYDGYTINSGSGTKGSAQNRCINVFGWLEAGSYIVCSTTDTIGGYIHKYSEEGTDNSFSGWLGAITLQSAAHSGDLYCKSFTLTERCFCRGVNSASIANAGDIMLIKGTVNPTAFKPFGWEYVTVINSNTDRRLLDSLGNSLFDSDGKRLFVS